MKFIVKVFPEIMMKSNSVRKRFMQVLSGNIRQVLLTIDETVAVVQHWDFIEVRHRDETKFIALSEQLQRISGIHHILHVEEIHFNTLDDIFEYTYQEVGQLLTNKTFCVRVKRRGNHDFNSMDVMRYVGGRLNQSIDSASVKLQNPDITVNIEIDGDKMMFVKNRWQGLGGFPMSTQEDVLSLISGGFDSSVASFLFMRRGSRVHYCFFNLGGQTHEMGVKQMAYHLWQRYGLSHKVKFVAVDFEPVVAEILQTIDDGQMGVVLKRMMVRVASRIAQRMNIEAIVTGEALGQVASQTLTNLRMIDEVSECLILRPLITHDKEEIIKLAEKIGTFEIASSMPEFCGVISKSPTVKARADRLAKEESKFNFEVLQTAIDTAHTYQIRALADVTKDDIVLPQSVSQVGDDEIVIDIRSPDDVDDLPLVIAGVDSERIFTIAFYKLTQEFAKLDMTKTYLLYCQQGVMSGLQATQLLANGYKNVKVLRLG